MPYATYNNPVTDPKLSPLERGQQAGYGQVSCDYNESTGEYNPYPLNSWDFNQYNDGFNGACQYMVDNFPWM